MPKYIEAVTVCVGYDDFLTTIIPFNLPMFDRWIIITDPADVATREVCRRFGLECLQTEDGRTNGDFCKGCMIERGLQHTSADGWRIHIDADVALPRHCRQLIEMAALQTDCIYGVDRVMIKSWDDWQKLQKSGFLEGGQYGYSHAVNFPQGFDVANRWASPMTGYVPIGFFQMWHSSQDEWHGIRVKNYPVRHNSACRTDVQFPLKWDRKKRILLPEIIAVHLESEPAKKGANWLGRCTKRFGHGDAKGHTNTVSSGS